MAVQALSNVTHRHLKFHNPAKPFVFAQEKLIVSLVSSELAHALWHLPIGFSLNGGKASVVGLMGLVANENLFVTAQGQWQGGYIPAALRAIPFGVVPNEDGSGQIVVIQDDGGHFSSTTGTPLFDAHGQATEFLQNMLNFLNAYKQNEAATARALVAITEADVLQPWDLNFTAPDGQAQKIVDLFCIDPEKFDALTPEQLVNLHATGALSLIYAHFFSLPSIAALEKMAREREPVFPSNLSFSILADDYLKF
jgi:hypothetical protein